MKKPELTPRDVKALLHLFDRSDDDVRQWYADAEDDLRAARAKLEDLNRWSETI